MSPLYNQTLHPLFIVISWIIQSKNCASKGFTKLRNVTYRALQNPCMDAVSTNTVPVYAEATFVLDDIGDLPQL
jgi:hypothetical protein